MYAYFGAGCFWGVEAEFRKLHGVIKTSVGYMGGNTDKPTYEEVCSGLTGHAEVVKIEYNNQVVSFEELLEIFMNIHDPSQLDRQGPDVGSQYRSVIFFVNNNQKSVSINKISDMNKEMGNTVVTLVEKQSEFFIGEVYHQKYLEKRGLSSCHINLT